MNIVIYIFSPPFDRRKWEWRAVWLAIAASVYFVTFYCTRRPYFSFALTYSFVGCFMLTAWAAAAIMEEFLIWREKSKSTEG